MPTCAVRQGLHGDDLKPCPVSFWLRPAGLGGFGGMSDRFSDFDFHLFVSLAVAPARRWEKGCVESCVCSGILADR